MRCSGIADSSRCPRRPPFRRITGSDGDDSVDLMPKMDVRWWMERWRAKRAWRGFAAPS
jgi:hypothetical protein